MAVNTDRMRRNLESTRGLVFSGQLLLELTARGMRREDAYRVVQGHAMEAWRTEGDFRARVAADPEVRAVLKPAEMDEVFRLERYLAHVDAMFARVFGTAAAAADVPRRRAGHPRPAALAQPRSSWPAPTLAARLVSVPARPLVARRARPRPTCDARLVAALKRPVTYALFLVGRLGGGAPRCPCRRRGTGRLDSALFVVAVAARGLALVRSYGIFLDWYAARPQPRRRARAGPRVRPAVRGAGQDLHRAARRHHVLQHFGVNVASLVVSLGVGSLAVGLAAQDTLANMFAGFTLMLDRPFRVGDRIQLASGEMGDVEAIGMRATLIKTPDDTILVVPNSLLVKERLVNLSRPTRRLTTRWRWAWPTAATSARVQGGAARRPACRRCVDRRREPVVLLARFGDFAVHFVVVFWANDYTQQGAGPRRGGGGGLPRAAPRRGSRSPVPRLIPPGGGPARGGGPMATARVYVTLKKSVFDPQGKTIHDALRSLGYGSVADVRQGKFFEVALDGVSGEQARQSGGGDRAQACWPTR